jgi:arylsulfatase A-like enzyme
MTVRPNILLVHSDQHRFDCVAANGHPFVQTPTLDRLAEEGTNFTRAFTPSPICSPARASLLNGAWPHQHGCMSIPPTEVFRPADAAQYPVWSTLLKEAGYHLSWIGKYHQELPGRPTDHGWDSFLPEGDYFSWRRDEGLPERTRENWWFGETDAGITPEQSRLAWGADAVISAIEGAAGDRPFVVRWDPSEPHLPNIIPEPYATMYPADEIEPWPGFADPLEGKPYIQSQQRRTWGVDGWTWDDWRPIVQRYLGEVTLLDHQLGRIVDFLKERELLESTLIIYTTDHGDMCGSHGMIDKHFIMYDDVMRVPLIVRWPENWRPAGGPGVEPNESIVIHELDVAATVCDAAGIAAPETFAGHSLRAIAEGAPSIRREHAFGTWHGGQFSSYSQRMIRTDDWKYVWNACAEDELYDLRDDPAEITNRATDPAYADLVAQARDTLVSEMEATRDVLLNEWTRRQLLENRKV